MPFQVIDNFQNRTVGGSSGSSFGTASDGINVWTQGAGTGTGSVASNEGSFTGFSGTSSYQCGTLKSVDMEIVCRFSIANLLDIVGLTLRATAPATYYRVRAGNSLFTIDKVVAGVITQLGSLTYSAITVNGYFWIRGRIVGSSILGRSWLDGTPEPTQWTNSDASTIGLTVSDSSITAAGQCGVMFKMTNANIANIANLDSFYAVDYANAENLQAVDGFSIGMSYTVTESAPTGDGFLNQESVTYPVDPLNASDSFLSVDLALLTDVTPMVDSGMSTGANITFIENTPVNDSFLAVDSVVFPTDPMNVSDSFLGVSNPQLVDVTPASDGMSTNQTTAFVESISINDTFTPTGNVAFTTDLLATSDGFTATQSGLFPDVTPSSDLFTANESVAINENAPVFDSFGSVANPQFADILNAQDVFTEVQSAALTESLQGIDGFTVQKSSMFSDLLNVSDGFTTQDGYSTIDGLNAQDGFTVQQTAMFIELLTALDTGTNSVQVFNVIDQLLNGDSFTSAQIGLFSDSLQGIDNFLSTNTTVFPSDQLLASDNFNAVALPLLIDQTPIQDNLVYSLNYVTVDGLLLSDSFLGTDITAFLDSAPAQDTFVYVDVIVPRKSVIYLQSVRGIIYLEAIE